MFASGQTCVKRSRKPVFQVFCDEDSPKLASTSSKNLRIGHPLAPESCLTNQTVFNNKENTIPELDHRTIPSRHVSRSSTRSRVLGERALSISTRVNCVDQWDSNIPFAPCGDKNIKPCKPATSKLQPSLERLSPKPLPAIDECKRSKPEQPRNQQIEYEVKSLDYDIHAAVSQVGIKTSSSRHSSSVDVGLDELLDKLEALQVRDEDGKLVDVLDPLPPNATCPGAPKIPTVFTMPLFVTDDGDFGDEDDQATTQKPTYRHQMSPLAEVTEAYTGLQGGWSPSPETLSPCLDDEVQAPCPIPLESPQLVSVDESQVGKEAVTASLPCEKKSFNFQRGREQEASMSFDQSFRVPAKGPLRL